jgi:flavin reductase (DIM6/NTAB) family NADH-FMN oxidoreductase RutF
MPTYTLQDLPTKEAHALLLGAVGPRPIALASTVDAEGNANLSPFSYFNVFSSNPPILVFSPARRVRNNTTKDTLRNAENLREVVINVVNYAIVQQTSLSSTEYPTGVNEFTKAGLTPVESETVKPFRVKESPAQFECRINDIVALGPDGGAGNLIICEVTRLHLDEAVLDANGQIDMHKIDLVARMGGAYYCRAQGEALFEVEKPLATLGMGVDALPASIRNSPVLRGNHLGQLGNVEERPPEKAVRAYAKQENISNLASDAEALHRRAASLLDQGDVDGAWKTLLCAEISL